MYYKVEVHSLKAIIWVCLNLTKSLLLLQFHSGSLEGALVHIKDHKQESCNSALDVNRNLVNNQN